MLFFWRKKRPVAPVWPWPNDTQMTEEAVRNAARISIRMLKLDARPNQPEYPDQMRRAVKTPEQSATLSRIWREELSAVIDQRNAARRRGDSEWMKE